MMQPAYGCFTFTNYFGHGQSCTLAARQVYLGTAHKGVNERNALECCKQLNFHSFRDGSTVCDCSWGQFTFRYDHRAHSMFPLHEMQCSLIIPEFQIVLRTSSPNRAVLACEYKLIYGTIHCISSLWSFSYLRYNAVSTEFYETFQH